LHGRVKHTTCMLRRLLPYQVSRLQEEDAYRQHKNRHGHQQNAEAEFPR